MTAIPPHEDEAHQAQPRHPPKLGALASGMVSVLFVSTVEALPILGWLVAPLGLIPVARYAASGRLSVRAWGWVVGGLLVASASGVPLAPTILAVYMLLVVLPILTIEIWQRLRWSEGRWVAVAAMLAVVGCLVASAVTVLPQAPVEGTAVHLREAIDSWEEASAEAGLPRGQSELQLDLFERLFSWVLPSLPVAYLVMVLFWIRPRLVVLGFPMEISTFEEYRSEEWLPAGFAVAGIATVALAGTARWVALNVLVAILILYFVHGLAIIRAHLVRWLGRSWAVRWGVGLLCLQIPVPVLVAALGLADSFFRLRPQTQGDGRQQ